MSVRAKFVVNTITRQMIQTWPAGRNDIVLKEMHTIKLFPIADGEDGENRKFWDATPQGSIELGVVNPAAVAVFADNLGRSVYVDFTPAD